MKTKRLSVLSMLVILTILVTQCGPTAEPQVVVQTVEVEKTVIETVEVEKEVIQTVEVEKEVVKEVEVTAVPEGPKPKGTLRISLNGTPSSLYIPLTPDKDSDKAASQLYDTLVWQDDNGDIVPSLAESWEVSEDGSEYTFHLREGVTFHNGEPFTADDVIATWEYGVMPEHSLWTEKYTIAQAVEKVDDYTVKITTDGPRPLLMITMHDFWSIIPDEYMAEVGVEGFQEHPIGTGPFVFEEWVKGDHITYSANPDYWRPGYPKVETLIFRPVPDSATRVAAIQADELDIVQALSGEEAQRLLGVEGTRVIKYPTATISYVAFNNMTTGVGQPTEDPKVRQAMNYAVDVDAIIDALFSGYGRPAAGYVASSELGYGIVDPFGYDPDKAKALLAEAGYPDGFDMGMACPAGAYGSFEEECEAIAGYLGEVGINIDLEIMESGHYWTLEAEKQLPPLFGDRWADESGEAYNRLFGALGGADQPYSSWDDPVIQDYLEEIATTVDREARKKVYEDLQVYMQENPPFIYLEEPMTFEAVRDTVQDYYPRAGGTMYYLTGTWQALGD